MRECPDCKSDEVSYARESYPSGVTGPDGHGEEWLTEDVAYCRSCGWTGDPEDLEPDPSERGVDEYDYKLSRGD